MENNRENKARFFAQYYLQFVMKIPFNESLHLVFDEWINRKNESWLELKSLSDITDEDAVEFFDLTSTLRYSDKYQKINHVKIELEYNTFVCVDLKGIDFLRSKGYALPYNNLSVKQQIEYGWIKVNQQPKNNGIRQEQDQI